MDAPQLVRTSVLNRVLESLSLGRVRINRWMPAAFVVLVLCFWIPPLVNHLTADSVKDYPLWYATGQLVMHGERIYPVGESFPFMYPPIAAIMLAPLSCAGQLPMILALIAVNSLAWTASILLAIRLATGKVFGHHPVLYVLPTLCSAPFAYDTFHLGQPNLLLLALMLGSFSCLQRGREWAAGALVAVAVGIKAFPLMAVWYLVYRRSWTALASVALTLVVLFLVVPFVVRGPEQGREDVTVWSRGMLFNYNQGAIGQRTLRAYSWKNQSLVGLANRFLRHKAAEEDADSNYYVNVADLDFRLVNSIIVGVALTLCLCYVAVMPRRGARTPKSDAIETAMLLTMILMFSPYSFGYFFVWLLYPYAVVCHLWLSAKDNTSSRVLGGCFLTAIVLMSLSVIDQRTIETYGNFFLTALVLFGTLGWQLRRMSREELQEGAVAQSTGKSRFAWSAMLTPGASARR